MIDAKNNLEVKYREIGELVPYVNNAKKHLPEQIDLIAGSIKEFGFNNPILLDGDSGIIAGHGRLQAARKLNMDTVPTIDLSHLTQAQKKAYILADNRIGEVYTEWDMELLQSELDELESSGFDIDLTGFDESFIADKEKEGLTDEDEVPELPEVPVTRLGDVWLMGDHRLLCGDSLSFDAMEVLMSGNIAGMVFTDPPYGVSYQSVWPEKAKRFDVLKNDNKILDIAPPIQAYSDGWIFIWTSWKVLDKWIKNTEALGYPTNIVIWSKGQGGMGELKKTFSTDYEVALVFNRGAQIKGNRIGSVWSIKKDNGESYVHPTQKPVALAEEAIDKTTDKGCIVLDMFGGSGSTLIACEKIARQCRLMELDQKYCDVSIKRWEDYTGKQATLEGDGRTFEQIKLERIDAST